MATDQLSAYGNISEYLIRNNQNKIKIGGEKWVLYEHFVVVSDIP